MVDLFFTKLNDLLEKCNLADEEKEFLEKLAEFMVFPDRDSSKDPRKLFSRSIQKLKEGSQFIPYMDLIYEYQKKTERVFKTI